MDAATVSLDTIVAVFCGCGTKLGDGPRNRPHNLECGHSMCGPCVKIGLKRVRAQCFSVRCNFNQCNRVTSSKTDSLPLNYSLIAFWKEFEAKRPPDDGLPSRGTDGDSTSKKRRIDGIQCAECNETAREDKMRMCMEDECDKFRQPICFVCCVDVHSTHAKGPYKDPESHVVKRGLHKRVDHSPYPDRRVITVGKEQFVVSASLLSLESPFFYKLFYGSVESAQTDSFTLNCNPFDFSDLLDHLYSTTDNGKNCCSECNSCRPHLLQLATELEMESMKERFEDKRSHDYNYIRMRSMRETERPLVTTRFPDARMIHVGSTTFLVSTTALSFFSDHFKQLFHSTPIKDQFEFTFDRCDSATFAQLFEIVEGKEAHKPSPQLLDVLHRLGKKNEYSACLDSIRQSIDNLPAEEISLVVRDVIEHIWRMRDSSNDYFNTEKNNIIKWTSTLSELDREWMYQEGLSRMEIVKKVKEFSGEKIQEVNEEEDEIDEEMRDEENGEEEKENENEMDEEEEEEEEEDPIVPPVLPSSTVSLPIPSSPHSTPLPSTPTSSSILIPQMQSPTRPVHPYPTYIPRPGRGIAPMLKCHGSIPRARMVAAAATPSAARIQPRMQHIPTPPARMAAAAADEEIVLDDTEEDKQNDFINIRVMKAGGRVYSWRIKRSTSVEVLFRLVRSRGCPEGGLHFGGHYLMNGKRLSHYGITDGSIITIE